MVRQEGKRFRTVHLEVRYLASLLRQARVGIIVPKHKQNSVARNRVKRRLREQVRLVVLPALQARTAKDRSPLDVVLRATPAAYGATYAELAADVSRLTQRLEAVG